MARYTDSIAGAKTRGWRYLVLPLVGVLIACSSDDDPPPPTPQATLEGRVLSGQSGLADYRVRVFASMPDVQPGWQEVGTALTNASGDFEVLYGLPSEANRDDVVLFVDARRGEAQLAGVVDPDQVGADATVVVNERTTVAVANAFAQFVHPGRVVGNRYGMRNAARMAGNLANPQTGATGVVLASSPNAQETSTLATFNTLANAVSACVADAKACVALREATSPAGAPPSTDTLQALANLVHYPAFANASVDPVFALASEHATYSPALSEAPNNWLLFLKITGGFYSEQATSNLMNGPGNGVFDEQGYLWVSDNYEPQAEGQFTCGGQRLLKFTPWGEPVPGTPYMGGGLNGAGYGIALDPKGDIWVGNFGFEDPPCQIRPDAAPHNSVSRFLADGTPVSPQRTGYTAGDISWPQGTVSDREGNIWMGNCGNNSATVYPGGNPNLAKNIPLPLPAITPRGPRMKSFGAVLDHQGNLWLTNNNTDSLSVISPAGEVIDTVVNADPSRPVFSHPIGNAVDSAGNVWVANSDWLDVPCPDNPNLGPAQNPSVTMVSAETREPVAGSPFTGGGVVLPWGISVDGDDTVWVFNFGVEPPGTPVSGTPTSISRFCGINASRCPPGLELGDPISPATGYQSNSLERLTAGQIDPSGNIWLMNNWKIPVNPYLNPGANAMVIVIGAAGPIKTPVYGPPEGF
ncbi:MAG: hypothetical protein AB7E55_17840 [Pigmentiphaga sp.]